MCLDVYFSQLFIGVRSYWRAFGLNMSAADSEKIQKLSIAVTNCHGSVCVFAVVMGERRGCNCGFNGVFLKCVRLVDTVYLYRLFVCSCRWRSASQPLTRNRSD